MKTVNLITMVTKDLPVGFYNWISKNEPSRAQIEGMLNDIKKELGESWDIKYEEFEQPHGKVKRYTYLLNDQLCTILVERRSLIEFQK